MASPISVVNVVTSAGRGAGDSDDADDDRVPFLSSSLPTVQGGGDASSGGSDASPRRSGGWRSRWRSLVDGVPVSLRRFPRLRGGLARVSGSADLRWLCRGLALCLLLLVVGIVGSFALRQMVSPEIDALMRERQDLRAGLELLKTQLDNMTRIADSRLDMIHLLESELEKQVVQAAEAAAAATDALANGTGALLPADGATGGDFRRGHLASNLVYTSLLGTLVFLFVLYRIVRIMQGELLAHRKLASGSTNRLEHGNQSSQSLSPPRSLRGILVDDDLATSSSSSRSNSSASSRSKGGNAALSPKSGPGSQPSPQCYKRPQNSPVDRLIV